MRVAFHARSVVFTTLLLCIAAPARAQVGASVSVDSDYQLRGVSLSDRKPAATVNLSYDRDNGAYVGASVAAVDTDHDGIQMLGYVAYAGYAGHLKTGASWDVGVTNASVSVYLHKKYTANYTEIYAGLSTNNISAHVYYSPNYLGEGASTVYVELNGTLRPARRWRLVGHVGALTPLSGPRQSGGRRERYDLRAGIVREFRGCELRLAWTTAAPEPVYPEGYKQKRNQVVLGATYFF